MLRNKGKWILREVGQGSSNFCVGKMLKHLTDHAEVRTWQAIFDDIQTLKANAFADKGTRMVSDDVRDNVYANIFDARLLNNAASHVEITAPEVGNAAKSLLPNKSSQPGAIFFGDSSAGAVSRAKSLPAIGAPRVSRVNARKSLRSRKRFVGTRDSGENQGPLIKKAKMISKRTHWSTTFSCHKVRSTNFSWPQQANSEQGSGRRVIHLFLPCRPGGICCASPPTGY